MRAVLTVFHLIILQLGEFLKHQDLSYNDSSEALSYCTGLLVRAFADLRHYQGLRKYSAVQNFIIKLWLRCHE